MLPFNTELRSQSAHVVCDQDQIKILLSGPYKVPKWFKKNQDGKGRTFIYKTNQFSQAPQAVQTAHIEATLDAIIQGLKNSGLRVTVACHVLNTKYS
jgi:hypothetical protein